MDKFIPKFNLYETLAMLIPGAVIVYLSLYQFHEKIDLPPEIFNFGIQGCRFNDLIVRSILFVILSYLVGILHHSLMDWFFNGLRNNEALIEYGIYKLETRGYYIDHKNSSNVEKRQLSLYEQIQDTTWHKCRYECPIMTLIINGLVVLRSSVCGWFCDIKKRYSFKQALTNLYYNAYYYVFSKNKGGAISSIESQIHAIRNMFIPLIVLFYKIIAIDQCRCVKFIGFIFFVALYLLMVERQQKVHERVFEDYEYLKRLETSM